MVNSPIGRTLAAVACTIVFSATCLAGAIGPAQAGGVAGAAMVVRPSA